MKKKFLSACMLLFLVAAGLSALWSHSSRDPVYEGSRLSEWLCEFDKETTPAQKAKATVVVRAVGTNALPYLLKMMRDQGSPLVTKLHQAARYQNLVEVTPQYAYRWRIVQAFRALGPMARPALPELAELMAEESTCCVAVLALVAIGPDSVPTLKNALHSTNEFVRGNAEWALNKLRVRTPAAV